MSSLKAIRCVSKDWARRKRAPPTLLPNCKFVIYLLDVLEEGRYLSAGELELRRACQERLALAMRERAAYWKQRGKFRAIREGDANTAFFHAQATQRLRRNNIRTLNADGVAVSSHHDKTVALTAHLQNLLRERAVNVNSINLQALYSGKEKVEPAPLMQPFTATEAHAAVRAMNRSSSPGPDGFGPAFYKAAWPTVSAAVMKLA